MSQTYTVLIQILSFSPIPLLTADNQTVKRKQPRCSSDRFRLTVCVLLVLAGWLAGSGAWAQQQSGGWCGTPSPGLASKQAFVAMIRQAEASRVGARVAANMTYVPITAWILKNSANQKAMTLSRLNQSIGQANQDFRAAQIQFFLLDVTEVAVEDTLFNINLNDNATQRLYNQANSLKSVNLYLVNKIGGGNITGAVYQSKSASLDQSTTIRLARWNSVYLAGYAYNNTLSHELGHYFGLYHPFTEEKEAKLCQDVEAVNGDNTHADFLDDTPADPFYGGKLGVDFTINANCAYQALNTVTAFCSVPFASFRPLTNNLMSYWQIPGGDFCGTVFTSKQISRIGAGKTLRFQATEFNLNTQPTLLTAPVLTKTAVGSGFALDWTALPGALGYVLERSTDPAFASFEVLTGLDAGVTGLSVSGDGGPWYHRIRASNSTIYRSEAPPAIVPTGNGSLAQAEYFFDTDPGYGQATALPASLGGSGLDATVPIPVNGLFIGIHSLGLRLRDNNNYWSTTHVRSFLVLGNGANDPAVQAFEYFIDTDPGFGNGTPASFATGNDGQVSLDLTLSGIGQGLHTLGVRVKDGRGIWSQTHIRAFIVLPAATAASISRIEYFLDSTDPGLGLASPVGFGGGTAGAEVTADLGLNMAGLSVGTHRITVRTRDSDGLWSVPQAATFGVTAPCTLPTATLSGSQTIAAGQTATLTVQLTGEAPWSLTTSTGQTLNAAATPFQFTVTPTVNTNYTLTRVANTCGTGTVGGQAAVALPITLRYFNGRMTAAGALLGWETAREENNAFFRVERSRDALAFEGIGTIESKAADGNSLLPLVYDYLDNSPWPGLNYYRLAQTDRDGTRTYSRIIALSRETVRPVLFPNPVTGGRVAQIEPALPFDHYELTDVLGRLVRAVPGPGTLQNLSLAGLSAGVYSLRVQTAEGAYWFRVVKSE
jgi:hypothetical protein